MLTHTVYGTWIYGFNTARAPGRFGIIAAGTIPPRTSTDVRLLRVGQVPIRLQVNCAPRVTSMRMRGKSMLKDGVNQRGIPLLR